MTPAYAEKWNLDVYSLECLAQEIGGPLPPLRGIGGILVKPTGFTMVNVQVPCVKWYNEEPVIRNVLVMQDYFSKHVVAYMVKDQTAHTTAETLRWGYFALFGAPAYLLSDKGPAFMGKVIEDLCKMYGVKKLRTSSYHAQTNGQVERMNQTLIRMIGKLEDDKKACWSLYLPEVLMAYNSTCSAVQCSLSTFW